MTFMPFPKPNKYPHIAKRWVHLCARSNFTIKNITRNTYICSKHFPDGSVLNVKANPTLEPFNARKQFKKKVNERRRVLRKVEVESKAAVAVELEAHARQQRIDVLLHAGVRHDALRVQGGD